MTEIVTSTGIRLDDSAGMAPSLTKYARDKGLHDARVFVARNGDKKTYILYLGEQPEYESQLAEHVAAHIDMLAIWQAGQKLTIQDVQGIVLF